MSLPRRFGFWTGWFVVIASMVGSGILTNPGLMLKTLPSYPALFALWATGGALALSGALTMGELSSGLPHVGGDYVYVREAFGRAWAFVYGWAMVILGFAAPVALVAYTTANYLAGGSSKGLASLLILFFTASHCFGHAGSKLVQSATTVFKLVVLVAFAVVCPLSEKASLDQLMAVAPSSTLSTGSLASGLILVMYAYTGWNAAVYLAGEIRDPLRNLPRCLAMGCFGVTLLYLAVLVAYGLTLPASEVAAMGDADASRLAELSAERLFGHGTARIFSVLLSLGVLASLSAYCLTGPRIVYAMAQDGLCPKIAGRVDARTGTPVLATAVQGALALLFLWSGTFEEVLNFTGYGLAVISTLVVSPIFVLRRRPDFRPSFRVPFYPLTPVLFLVASLAMLVGGAIENPWNAASSLLCILAAFPVFLLWNRYFPSHR